MQAWWARVPLGVEGDLETLKADDDETVVDLFAKVVSEVQGLAAAARGRARARARRA